MPTGVGKSRLMARAAETVFAKRETVLILNHRLQLGTQFAQDLDTLGITYGYIDGQHDPEYHRYVQVSTLQSFGRRFHKIVAAWAERRMPLPSLIIHDEAHWGAHLLREVLDTLKDTYNHVPLTLGFTATPITTAGYGLGNTYEAMICGPDILEATDMDFLVPLKLFHLAPPGVDPRNWKVNSKTNEYIQSTVDPDLRRGKVIGHVFDTWDTMLRNDPTIIITGSVPHSVDIMNAFQERGVPCPHIDADTPQNIRRKIFDDFKQGRIGVFTNADLVSEGVDFPWAVNLQHAGTTNSPARWIQRIGRVLRPLLNEDKTGWARNLDGSFKKPFARVVDHGFCFKKLGHPYEYTKWELGVSRYTPAQLRAGRKGTQRECPKCHMSFSSKKCPNCGYVSPQPQRPVESLEQLPGVLLTAEVGGGKMVMTPEQHEKLWYEEVRWIVRDMGKKDGWAYYLFKQQFGKAPPRTEGYSTPRWRTRQEFYGLLGKKKPA